MSKYNNEFETELVEEEDSFQEGKRKALMTYLREKHEKHREEVKKMEEMKALKLETEQEKINFLLEKKDSTHKAYLMRRVQSAKYKSKYETEKIKNKIQKVDEYMKKIDINDKIAELKDKAQNEINEETKKSKKSNAELSQIITRLYRLNPKDEIERVNNKKKIENRKNFDKKKNESRKNELINMVKNQEEQNFYLDNNLDQENKEGTRNNIKKTILKVLSSPNQSVFTEKKNFPLIKNTEKNSYKNPYRIKDIINPSAKDRKFLLFPLTNNKKGSNMNSASKLKKNFTKEDNEYDNLIAIMNPNDTSENNKDNVTKKMRPKSAGYKNKYTNDALYDLNQIKKEFVQIKKNGFKLEDIEIFKKKYSHLDISSLLHQAKLKIIKQTSKNIPNNEYIGYSNRKNISQKEDKIYDNKNAHEKNLKDIKIKKIERNLYREAKKKLDENSDFQASEESKVEAEFEEGLDDINNTNNQEKLDEFNQNNSYEAYEEINNKENEIKANNSINSRENLAGKQSFKSEIYDNNDEIKDNKFTNFLIENEENFNNCANENSPINNIEEETSDKNNNIKNNENHNPASNNNFHCINEEYCSASIKLASNSSSKEKEIKENKVSLTKDQTHKENKHPINSLDQKKKLKEKHLISKYKKLENYNPKKSYIAACLFNNTELIQAHLLSCRDDEEIFKMLNEKDIYGRKGINYLILNCNLDMIKLNLMSGLILGDTIDKFKRNILHYCALIDCKELIDVVIRCIIFENKEQLEEMKLYMEKAFLKKSENNKNITKDDNLPRASVLENLNFLENSFIDKNIFDIEQILPNELDKSIIISFLTCNNNL